MNIEGQWGLLGRVLGLLTITATLAGCGDSAESGGSAGKAVTTAVVSATPSVSGSPAATVVANTDYSFHPTSAAPTGTSLTFSIQNKPAWASFSSLTGQLSGTPSASDAGDDPNIIITASDGTASAALRAFSIQVTSSPNTPTVSVSSSGTESSSASSSSSSSGSSRSGGSLGSSSSSGAAPISITDSVTLSWSAPTENTNGSALTNLAGYVIYYGTSATTMTNKISINTVGMLTYVISNLASGTWYFAVLAVNASGVESSPSATVRKTI